MRSSVKTDIMRIRTKTSALFLLLANAGAWAQVTPSATVEEKKCAIEGRVVNALTGAPLRKASVRLYTVRRATSVTEPESSPQATSQATTTDAGGRFVLPAVDAGQYMLRADAMGHERGEYGARKPGGRGSVLSLSAGAELKDLVLKLTPQAAFTGKVSDQNGEPVQYAQVLALAVRYHRGRKQLFEIGSARSDDRGQYRMENLRPGRHYLVVAPPPDAGLGRRYYPGVTDLAQAQRVAGAPGGELGGLDFRLQKEPGVRVSGYALDGAGRPLSRADVTIVPHLVSSGVAFGAAIVRPDGAFAIANVTKGSYKLRLLADIGHHIVVEKQIEVQEHDVTGVAMVAHPPQPLAGTIVIPGLEKSALKRVRVLLDRQDGLRWKLQMATADESGAFVLNEIFPAPYRVMAFGLPSGAYISSVKAGGREVQGRDVDFSERVPDGIEVVAKPDGATVSGTVLYRGAPFAEARVVLVPQDSHPTLPNRFTSSREDGTFTITGIPPGTYRLFAWEEVEPGAWEDPEFMRPYEKEGFKIVLESRATESVRVNLIPAAN